MIVGNVKCGNVAPTQAVVQTAGQAYRLPAHLVEHEIHHAGPVLDILLRYTQAMMTQVVQNAMWSRHRSVSQ